MRAFKMFHNRALSENGVSILVSIITVVAPVPVQMCQVFPGCVSFVVWLFGPMPQTG